jgi:hypothetical protein
MNTQGMTPEEKAVVMQFMGQTYGQLHQQDQNIVGTATNLKPKSQEMKRVFEETAHMPTIQQQPLQPPLQQQAPAPPPVQQITPEQAAAELQLPVAEPVPIRLYDDEQKANPNQMELDLSEPTVTDKLLDLLKEQNLLLKEISLKLDNGKKTTKGRKQS